MYMDNKDQPSSSKQSTDTNVSWGGRRRGWNYKFSVFQILDVELNQLFVQASRVHISAVQSECDRSVYVLDFLFPRNQLIQFSP